MSDSENVPVDYSATENQIRNAVVGDHCCDVRGTVFRHLLHCYAGSSSSFGTEVCPDCCQTFVAKKNCRRSWGYVGGENDFRRTSVVAGYCKTDFPDQTYAFDGSDDLVAKDVVGVGANMAGMLKKDCRNSQRFVVSANQC